jgi:hypothetical protein
MTKLNASFRARIKNQSQSRTLTATNIQQLNAWREARTRGEGMGLFLAMRRAAQRSKQKREMERLTNGGNSEPFAERRAQQLNSWRLGKISHLNRSYSWQNTHAMQGTSNNNRN